MKTKTLSYTPILFCILILWSACKDDADAPLRFYDSKYEVPMEEDATSESKAETETTLWKSEIPASQVPESKAAGAEFPPDE